MTATGAPLRVLAPVLDLASAPGGGVVSQAVSGAAARTLRPTAGGWVEAEIEGERGFVDPSGLGTWPAAARDLFVTSVEALAYPAPTRRAGPPVERLPLGARLAAEPADRDVHGFVSVTVRGARRWVQAEDLAAAPLRAAGPAERLAVAASLLGRPYVWGGCSSLGLDCSGLTRLLAGLAGVRLPHSAAAQAAVEADRFGVVGGEPEPGDFIYLRPPGQRIEHVAVVESEGVILHASAEHGPPCVRRELRAALAEGGEVACVRRLRDRGTGR